MILKSFTATDRRGFKVANPYEQIEKTKTKGNPYAEFEAPPARGWSPSIIDEIVGGVETFGTFATGIVAEPIAGIVGLGSLAYGGADLGAEMVEKTREALTYKPRTAVGQENLQSIAESDTVQAIARGTKYLEDALGDIGFRVQGPELAALMATIPTATMELIGFKGTAAAQSIARKMALKRSLAEKIEGASLKKEVEDIRAPGAEAGLEQAATTVQAGKMVDMPGLIKPDQKYYEIASELGIDVNVPAGFASQNPSFRAMHEALASVPASDLAINERQFIAKLAEKSDGLIEKYGGTLDKDSLSQQFKDDSLKEIESLETKADSLYNKMAAKIPGSSRIDAINTMNYVNFKISELGGKDRSTSFLNQIARDLRTVKKEGPTGRIDLITGKRKAGLIATEKPTFERLNLTRQRVGQALQKKTGLFRHDDEFILKALYSVLKKDQLVIADLSGLGGMVRTADQLIIKRKWLEKNMVKLLGKDLERSLMPTVGLAMRKLEKGHIDRWDAVMRRIDNPALRQEVAVSAINEIFTGGRTGKALSPLQYTRFMDSLARNKTARRKLYRELPSGLPKALEDIHYITKGITRAQADRVTTGRLREFFEQKDGMIKRLMGRGLEIGAGLKAGPLAGEAVRLFLQQETGGAKAASAVLASPEFAQMLKVAAREGYTEGSTITQKLSQAERAFERSASFKKWAAKLDDAGKSQLAVTGILGYLLNSLPENPREQLQ